MARAQVVKNHLLSIYVGKQDEPLKPVLVTWT
jgi:hypothetical protein